MAIATRNTKARKVYMALVEELPLWPISNEKELDRAAKMLDRLLDDEKLSTGSQAYLDVLTRLVSDYEDQHHAIEPASDSCAAGELDRYPAMPMLTLQDVTGQNWVNCTRLSLHDYQLEYVASNVATIAESKYEQHHQLRAIFSGEQLVGMLAYCHETDPEDLDLYWIFRLMIAKDHQRSGFAADAIKLAMLEIRQLGGKRIRTMHKPENTAASALYRKLEFHVIGSLDDGDTLLEHHLNASVTPESNARVTSTLGQK